ncbi:MAG: CoA ester lyase [Burkholderiales bacterium]|nr:CoA ester lyase [Burkholderiales bacterium]
MNTPAPRSYLFVPAHRPDRYAKACAAGADAVIVDLEDAVPADTKDEARRALGAWLPAAPKVLVRINAVDTPWFGADLELCRFDAVAAVVLAKAERPQDIEHVSRHTGKPVVAQIESAHGIANVIAIAEARGTQRLAFGAIDLALDLGMVEEPDVLMPLRLQLALASRLSKLPAPIDGVTTAIDDVELTTEDTRRAKRLGFGAKLCIHPKQVKVVHRAFAPSPEEVAWARRVMEAAQQSGGAAVAVDGRMIDTPVIGIAEQILRDAER